MQTTNNAQKIAKKGDFVHPVSPYTKLALCTSTGAHILDDLNFFNPGLIPLTFHAVPETDGERFVAVSLGRKDISWGQAI